MIHYITVCTWGPRLPRSVFMTYLIGNVCILWLENVYMSSSGVILRKFQYIDHPVLKNCFFGKIYTILHHSLMRFRICSKIGAEWYIDHPIWWNYLVYSILDPTIMGFRISLKIGSEWYIDHIIWWNYHFWLDLLHISSYYHVIQNLFEKWFRMIYRSSNLVELPFLVRSTLH